MKTATNAGPLIFQLLLERGLLDPQHMESVRQSQLKDSRTLEEILISSDLVSDRDIALVYSQYLSVPLFEPGDPNQYLDGSLAELLTEKICREQLLVPVRVRGQTLDLAFVTPNEMLVIDEIQLLTGLTVRPLIAPLSVVLRRISLLFDSDEWNRSASGQIQDNFAHMEAEEITPDDDQEIDPDEGILHLDQPLPPGRDGRIIWLVNQLLEQAVHMGASDIHIEPFENSCKVRLRIDGVLQEMRPPPFSLFIPMVSRIKVLAKMDIAEKRLPQDGAIALKSRDRRVDLRVSTMPTVYGEKVALRVLDKSAIPNELTSLGLDRRQADDLAEAIRMPHGLLLVTGPTGSGKSTTLYSCLNQLNGSDRNICTVEDPVEYKFPGVNQVQVKSQVGFTFANALRAFLRQDPDVLMVGEVRDAETAEICMRAALTGHFVLSTLHTNDALSAVSRLLDMDIEPFLLASTLRLLEAQRLIRRLCEHCKQPYPIPDDARRFGLEAGREIFRPAGCDQCRETGYHGRIGVFEVVRITDAVARLIQSRAPHSDLCDSARKQGVKLLFESATEKVREGITSLEEALSLTISNAD